MPISKIRVGGTDQDIKDARLPSVTSSDNGKILQVGSGSWSVGITITVSSSEPTSAQGSDGDIWIVI